MTKGGVESEIGRKLEISHPFELVVVISIAIAFVLSHLESALHEALTQHAVHENPKLRVHLIT